MKNKTLWFTFSVVILALAGVYFGMFRKSSLGEPVISESPEPSETTSSSPSPSPSPDSTSSPQATPRPSVSKVPLPSGDGKTTFIDEKVPWELLLADASCELKGEIKFLNEKTYDNQDAVFIYKGIDHPGRNIKWTITPAEPNLGVGPNIFSKIPIPNGQALLGVFPAGQLSAKRYELTALIEYGRLIDENGKFVTENGNVKIFQKPCRGKTTIVFP